MQHAWKHVERPGGSHTALDGKKKVPVQVADEGSGGFRYVPEGSGQFRCRCQVKVPREGGKTTNYNFPDHPRRGSVKGGGLRGPRRGSVKGGALGAEEGEAGAGLG